jgi:hypothetical protein
MSLCLSVKKKIEKIKTLRRFRERDTISFLIGDDQERPLRESNV